MNLHRGGAYYFFVVKSHTRPTPSPIIAQPHNTYGQCVPIARNNGYIVFSVLSKRIKLWLTNKQNENDRIFLFYFIILFFLFPSSF